MPRAPRPVLAGQPIHLIQRGNNRSICFVDDDDREQYERALQHASARARCPIHAYVLMTNHVHLLVTATEPRSPSRMMQALGRSYVRWFNDRHGRTGTLWEGRFRSTLVDSDRYFLACSRYIESNPVRAGLATSPGQYRWSSFGANALGEPDRIVTPHHLYHALGSDPSSRQSSYRALFLAPPDLAEIDAIRQATNRGTILGPESCRHTLETALGRPLGRRTHGGDRRSRPPTPPLPK